MPSSSTLTIKDETASGTALNSLTLECLTERMSVREIIRARIYQEVQEYNRTKTSPAHIYKGLVQPTDAERTLNGYKLRTARDIEWEKQYELALKAFESNGFFILVGDRQLENLDDELDVAVEDECSFVKLTPLVGG